MVKQGHKLFKNSEIILGYINEIVGDLKNHKLGHQAINSSHQNTSGLGYGIIMGTLYARLS